MTAYIQLPLDELDAEYTMMDNQSLKCSVNTDLLKLKVIKNPLIWNIYKFNYARSGVSKYLPNMPYKDCHLSQI